MLLKLIDQKVREAFSNAAMEYEVLTELQNEIGRDLVRKVQTLENCALILDAGMGTGRMANRLSFMFPEARVVGLDFAPGMVKVAQEKYGSFKIVQADARAFPFRDGSFDLVVSNLMYQWVEDLAAAFADSRRILKPGGVFCATLFGRRTLQEMFASLEASGEPSVLPLRRLPSLEETRLALRAAGLCEVEMDYEIIKVHFLDLFDLLKWLKSIGANVLQERPWLGRSRLAQADEYYKTNFKDRWGVTASFEVIWIKAVKE